MKFASSKPYPEIKVEKKNLAYASILLNDYTAKTSELTAINQYIYQNFILAKTNKKIAEDLKKIAIVEMHHLEILGKLIYLLGVYPKYKFVSLNGNYLENWQSEFVNYNTSLKEILVINLKMEQETIRKYQKHIELINDKYIKEILLRIIADECLHVLYFENEINLLN